MTLHLEIASWLDSFLSANSLIALFLAEFTLKIVLNPAHLFGVVENHKVYEEISQRLRSTALSVAGLVFAGLALIYSSRTNSLVGPIELFSVSLGLLLIAAFSHELTRTYRIVLTFQEMALEYGLLFLVYSFYVTTDILQPGASDVAFAVFMMVLVFRFLSLKGELEAHNNEFGRCEYESRVQFFKQYFSSIIPFI